MKLSLISIFPACALLASCSDPKAATEANFEKALQSYYDTRQACVRSPFDNKFPTETTLTEDPLLTGLNRQNQALETGLFVKSNEVQESGLGKYPHTKVTVDLSPLGKKFYKERKTKFGEVGEFCYGKNEVQEIVRFTEPSDAMGITISQVTYKRQVTNVADWAKTKAAKETWERISDGVDAPTTENAVLVLTNKGWVHDSDARN